MSNIPAQRYIRSIHARIKSLRHEVATYLATTTNIGEDEQDTLQACERLLFDCLCETDPYTDALGPES